jgi:cytidylate kinase
MIISVDGYSSTGKSTLAKDIARHYKIKYIDSGAMYRAVTYIALNNKWFNPETKKLNVPELLDLLDNTSVDFKVTEEGQYLTLNGNIIEEEIRTMKVSESVSYISKYASIRSKLVEKQRKFAESSSLVMDGRDIGTIVFPNADVKFFVDAKPEVRAKRRYDELINKGYPITFEEVKKNLLDRDHLDENRKVSPLKKAPDAILIDNTDLSRDEQLVKAIEIINKKAGKNFKK